MIAGIGLYLIMGAAVLAFIGGTYWKGHESGKESQRQTDAPIIAKANADAATAKSANDSLARDLKEINGRVATCNRKVSQLNTIGQQAIAERDRAIAAAQARDAQEGPSIAKLKAEASAPPTGTPQQQCDRGASILGDLADFMRAQLPPQNTPPAPAASQNTVPSEVPAQPPKPAATPAPAPSKSLPSAIRRPK